MSSLKCKGCGSTNIDTDPARGDTFCIDCGVVQAESGIVAETAFEEAAGGNMVLSGHYVSNESSGGGSGFGSRFFGSNKESKEITLQNARKGIAHLGRQLQLTQHQIDQSVVFYKMALTQHLTRGRKQAHNHAACVYITCRTEQTPHMLIDISDILQICVHELGRTYLKFIEALNIRIPSMGKSWKAVDPCLYILRFANKLEFGSKTNDVSNTAMRVVKRMKKDSIHSGRRPSGLCGAALLMAARLHEFSRSPSDIIKIVKVHESTLRKRLIEFGDTPSSALTLDEFMSVDLEEEQDPPAFKAARKKDRERLQKLENMASEFNELQSEIDRQLEEQKSIKGKIRNSISIEESDTERFITESNLSVIEKCVNKDPNDPDDPDDPNEIEAPIVKTRESHLVTGLGPDIATMGLNASLQSKDNDALSFENLSGEIDITDLDDDELDGYIMSEKEANIKSNLWNKVNEKYLQEQKEKEEKQQKEKEEGKPEKKRRRTAKKNRNQGLASSAGEAIEKMLQEKRISSKINYEVLKSLNVGIGANSQTQQKKTDDAAFATPKPVEPARETTSALPVINTSPKKVKPRILDVSRRTPNFKIPSTKRKASVLDEESAENAEEPVPIPTPILDTTPIDEMDDEEPDEEPEPEEESFQSMGQLLRQNDDDDGYGYGYGGYDDEEDY